MTMAEWSGVLGKYWTCPWIRSSDDVTTAAAEIRETFGRNSPDNDEIVRAIRWLAGPENKKQEKCPTLRELIRAVAILRKQDREERDNPRGQGQACAMCHGGWAVHYTGWAATWTTHDYMQAYSTAIPCKCSEGARVMGIVKDYKDMTDEQAARIDRMRSEAVEQWKAMQRAENTGDR